jgi:hypothetical protein
VKSVPWTGGGAFPRGGGASRPENAGPEEAAPLSACPAGELTVAAGEGEYAALRPFFDEKPFLIKFSAVLRLFPGAETAVTVDLPPLLRFEADGTTLFSFRPFVSGDTWYGDTMKGFLCSCLAVDFAPYPKTAGPPLVPCTVSIKNSSALTAELDHVLLYADELSIYENYENSGENGGGNGESSGGLLCDTPVIEIFDGDFRMSVKTAAEDARLVSEGVKNSVGDMLIRRGAEIIKNITGYS